MLAWLVPALVACGGKRDAMRYPAGDGEAQVCAEGNCPPPALPPGVVMTPDH